MMYHYLSMIALTIMVLTSSNAYAQQLSLNLAPNGSKVVTNHYGWKLSATCSIQTKTKNTIRVSVVDNNGSVNGKNLTVGQSTSVTVHNHDNISVSAEPGTQVILHNLSDDAVQATCST